MSDNYCTVCGESHNIAVTTCEHTRRLDGLVGQANEDVNTGVRDSDACAELVSIAIDDVPKLLARVLVLEADAELGAALRESADVMRAKAAAFIDKMPMRADGAEDLSLAVMAYDRAKGSAGKAKASGRAEGGAT
jgi:hypothetical protein